MTELHPLLQRASKYKRRDLSVAPAGCDYDDSKGLWVESATGQIAVDQPFRPGPTTKKADIETGEDQKGR